MKRKERKRSRVARAKQERKVEFLLPKSVCLHLVSNPKQKIKQRKESKVLIHHFFKFLNILFLGSLFHSSSVHLLVLSSGGEGFPWPWCELLGNILGNPLERAWEGLVALSWLSIARCSCLDPSRNCQTVLTRICELVCGLVGLTCYLRGVLIT